MLSRAVGIALFVALPVLAGAAPLDGAAPLGREPDERTLTAKPADAAPLIALLGHGDWRVREKAMHDLVALGGAARDALRKAARSQDAEVRWRASYALSRLDADLGKPEPDKARLLYASAAQARRQRGAEAAARLFYQAVVKRYPDSRWAAAARERLAELDPAAAPLPGGAPSEKELERLVARLGSPSWAERQQATWRLAALGPAAKAALERAAEGADREAAWRAKRLLERIELADKGARSRAEARSRSLRMGMLARLFGDSVAPNRPTDLDGLVRALAGDDAGDVAHAREVLLNLGTDAVPALIRGLEGCGEVAAVEAIDLLRQITGQDIGFASERWLAWWRKLRKGSD
jgi:hypothetical protein